MSEITFTIPDGWEKDYPIEAASYPVSVCAPDGTLLCVLEPFKAETFEFVDGGWRMKRPHPNGGTP